MSFEQGFTFLLGAGLACLGWFASELYKAINKLKDDLGKLEARIGSDYVRYDRLKDMLDPIAASINEIRHELIAKQDRP